MKKLLRLISYSNIKKCPFCGCKELVFRKSGDTTEWNSIKKFLPYYKYLVDQQFNYYECLNCCTWITNPMLNPFIVNMFYKKYMGGKIKFLPLYNRDYRKEIFELLLQGLESSNLATNFSGKKFLDIGCAQGSLLEVAQARNLITFGIEMSKDASRIAQNYGRIYTGDALLNLRNFDDCSMDYICAIDTIEHLQNAYKVMLQVYKKLCVGGLFILEVPNQKSEADEMSRHYYLFNEEGLKNTLLHIGFSDIQSIDWLPQVYNLHDNEIPNRFIRLIAHK